jgi:Domain of unknown function (DUF1707)
MPALRRFPIVDGMSNASDSLRVSDDDRERVAAVLRDAVGRGQLSLAEVDGRLRAAYAAVTRADLAAVTADLPAAAPPRPRVAVPAQAPVPAGPAAGWRPWLGVSLLLLAIWTATSLAAGHALFFWPAFPIGFWALSMLGARSGHGCRTASPHRS